MASPGSIAIPIFAHFAGEEYEIGTITLEVTTTIDVGGAMTVSVG